MPLCSALFLNRICPKCHRGDTKPLGRHMTFHLRKQTTTGSQSQTQISGWGPPGPVTGPLLNLHSAKRTENGAFKDCLYLKQRLLGCQVGLTNSGPFLQAWTGSFPQAWVMVELLSASPPRSFPFPLPVLHTCPPCPSSHYQRQDDFFSEIKLPLFASYPSHLENPSTVLHKVSKLLLPRFITFIG